MAVSEDVGDSWGSHGPTSPAYFDPTSIDYRPAKRGRLDGVTLVTLLWRHTIVYINPSILIPIVQHAVILGSVEDLQCIRRRHIDLYH